MFKSFNHPKTIDKVRAYLAKYSLTILVVHFLLLILVISLVFSIMLFLLNKEYSFISYSKFFFLQLLGRDYHEEIISNSSIGLTISYFILSILRLVLPALFLGAIVFKLFIKKSIITYRNIISIYKLPNKNQNILGIRLYNSSKLLIVDVTFKLFMRIRYIPPSGLPYLKNIQLKTLNPVWPIAITHVPYTLAIPLDEQDIKLGDQNNQKFIISIQGNKLGDNNRIIVIIKGCIPELGTDFVETQWYNIPDDTKFGKYYDIDIDYNTKSKQWNGWANFDSNKEQ